MVKNMRNNYPILFSALLAISFALQGCTEKESEVSVSVVVAEPKRFDVAAPDGLGVNENGKGMTVGEHPADITIKDMQGKDFAVSSAWAEQPALIVFYRGGWCPYCNGQVRELSESYSKFEAAGVQPVLISVDTPDKSAMVKAKYDIPFPVLSDPGLEAHKAFNVVLELDAKTQAQYQEYGIDLQKWSGEPHASIAVASAFIVDMRGHVVFSHAPADFKTRPSAEQLLGLIQNLEI